MNTKVCKQCHRLFSRIGEGNLCALCQKKEYDLLQSIKKYFETNPKATLEEISESNHVSISTIKGYLRDNRLHLPSDSVIELYCKQCSTPILSGNLCPSCRHTLKHALKIAAQSIQLEQQSKSQTQAIKHHKYHSKRR